MADQLAVWIEVKRSDGSMEKVRVGSATKDGDGFVLHLGELNIGGAGAPAAAPMRASASAGGGGGGGGGGEVFPNYGRSKGMPIRGASRQDLDFYKNGAMRTLNDPGKARFHDKERGLLAAIEAEISRQGGGDGGDDGPPPHGDDDGPPPF
jgi:hypothetical protein